MEHFDRKPLRKAEFIRPPNTLKQKVGMGGVSDDILDKAQKLLEENTHDFRPLGLMYLKSLMRGIEAAKMQTMDDDPEQLIAGMLYPAMQLKANGGMFHYKLITQMGDQLVQFLEVIETPDIDAIELVLAFHSTMDIVFQGHITGDGGDRGHELLAALEEACVRYFKAHPEKEKTIQ